MINVKASFVEEETFVLSDSNEHSVESSFPSIDWPHGVGETALGLIPMLQSSSGVNHSSLSSARG